MVCGPKRKPSCERHCAFREASDSLVRHKKHGEHDHQQDQHDGNDDHDGEHFAFADGLLGTGLCMGFASRSIVGPVRLHAPL
jgi:hypothetical protein